jgi:hypothetical protein
MQARTFRYRHPTRGGGAASPTGLLDLSVACLAQLFAVIMAVALLPRSR